MLIRPAELFPDPLEIRTVIAEGDIDYAQDVRQTGPVHVQGRAERIEEHHGPKDVIEDIRLRARVEGSFELLCARCLDPIQHSADETFDLIFRPSGTDAEPGERAITEAETEIGYYEGNGLLLEDVVREQILLSLPDRSLCREDCKGLCPRCGANLNVVPCDCVSVEVDPRWHALQGLTASKASSTA